MNARLQPAATLRALRIDDLGAVLEVEVQCYSFPWSRGNFVDSLAAGYRAEALWHTDYSLVGYCVAQPGVDEMHLLNLTTAPRWQRQGHASHLLQRLFASCREQGLAVVLLEVRPSNLEARALYAKHGFAEVGRRRGYYPAATGREDALVLRAEMALR